MNDVVRLHAPPKGTTFARLAIALAAGQGSGPRAANIATKYDLTTPSVARILEKAATSAGSTASTSWAAANGDFRAAGSEFIELVSQQTIIGKLRGVRHVPFNVRLLLSLIHI